MVQTLAAHVFNVLPKWHFLRPAGRLIWATLLLAVAVAFIFWLCSRPKPAEPATWAQAMLGAVMSFGLMLLAYATVPHEWLTFGNSYLHLSESKFLVRSGQQICSPIGSACTPLHWLNFSINKHALLDTVAALIYVVFLSLNVALFAKWQKRPAGKPAAAGAAASGPQPDDKSDAPDVEVGTSAYGRPLTAKV